MLTEQDGRPITLFTDGVEAQHCYAREVADSAAKRAVATAEQARLRAEALATWDSLDAVRDFYDTTDQSFALKTAEPDGQ